MFTFPWILWWIPSFLMFIYGMHLLGSNFPAFKEKYSLIDRGSRYERANSDYGFIRFWWIFFNSLLVAALSFFWPIGLLVMIAIIFFGKGAGKKPVHKLEKELARSKATIAKLEDDLRIKNQLIQNFAEGVVENWQPPQTPSITMDKKIV
jgi:hypothetical protein